jgi:hypothetical protein
MVGIMYGGVIMGHRGRANMGQVGKGDQLIT